MISRFTSLLVGLAHVACAVILVRSAVAQLPEDRYELGRRIHRYELAWETAETPARLASQDDVDRAVRSFFALRFRDAAAAVDRAWQIAAGRDEPSPAEVWCTAISWRAPRAVRDVAQPRFDWQAAAYYPVEGPAPESAEIRLMLRAALDGPALSATTATYAGATWNCVPLDAAVEAGDYWLVAEAAARGETWPLGPQQVSLVEDLAARTRALELAAEAVPPQAEATHAATLGFRAELLSRLAAGEPYEAGLPVEAFLRETEGLAAALQAGEPYFTPEHSGEFLLTVAVGTQRVPTRLLVPASDGPPSAGPPSARPLVLALHGMGGSENMFFFAYGAGKAVRLAQERGWLFAAPRLPLLGLNCSLDEYIAALAALHPIDRQRVFVIGHSMGAAAAIDWAQQAQTPPAALVPLGGGGRLTSPERLRDVPTFIGVGSRDFLRNPAVALHQGLQTAGVAQLVYREYEGIEHLTVVQAALDDVYAFFDEVAARNATTGD